MIEEIAVSPAERLRLITIDSHEFVMLCGKGIQPSLVPVSPAANQIPKLPVGTAFAADEQPSSQLSTSKPLSKHDTLELTTPAFAQSEHTTELSHGQAIDSHQIDAGEVAAFAAKFKGWRKNNDASNNLHKADHAYFQLSRGGCNQRNDPYSNRCISNCS